MAADFFEFNGKRYLVANSADFRLMLTDLTQTTDEVIGQVERIKGDLGQTIEEVFRLRGINRVNDGGQIGLAAALSQMTGRQADRPALPSAPPSPIPQAAVVGALPLVSPYSAATAYQPGAVVSYGGGLFQWQALTASVAGTSPLSSSSWVGLSQALDPYAYSSWTYVDITSPAFAAVAAPAATITGQQTTAGAALAPISPITIPGSTTLAGHLDVEVVTPQNTPGITLPVDATVSVRCLVSWSNTAGAWTVTPQWQQVAVASAAAIAAAAAGVYRASIR